MIGDPGQLTQITIVPEVRLLLGANVKSEALYRVPSRSHPVLDVLD